MHFSTLGLSPALSHAVSQLGFAAPTPIQAQAIAPALQAQDVMAQAQTGSGKTLAYVLPLLQRLPVLKAGQAHGYGRGVYSLVVVPTRELAAQVGEVIAQVARHLPANERAPKVCVVTGGVSINPQMMALRGGADVLVGTPGRLLDLARNNAIQLACVRLLVLDEADRLLDLGFADELAHLLKLLPPSRQTLLFSATYPTEVQGLAQRLLHKAIEIKIESESVEPTQITQRAIAVDASQRTRLLRHLIAQNKGKRLLVFVATKYAAEMVAEKLYKAGIYATAFHGELSQGARKEVLAEFKDEQWEVLITTDLAARGIDIAKLPIVVNFDLPRSAVDYTHRIGRTGRAGEAGLAISFVTADDGDHFALIQKRQNLQLELEQIPGFEPKDQPTPRVLVANDKGGIKGKRPSKKDKLRAAAAQNKA